MWLGSEVTEMEVVKKQSSGEWDRKPLSTVNILLCVLLMYLNQWLISWLWTFSILKVAQTSPK